MTPAGIEPATFRFVAQHLNHLATAVPLACAIIDTYLGSFAKLRKATIGFVLSAFRPQGTTRRPLDGFLLNLLYVYLGKCVENI